MSRGLGKMERELLETIGGSASWAGRWLRLKAMAQLILMDDAGPLDRALGYQTSWGTRYPSVKRAARSLERKGLIERISMANQCWVKVKSTPVTGTLNDNTTDGAE